MSVLSKDDRLRNEWKNPTKDANLLETHPELWGTLDNPHGSSIEEWIKSLGTHNQMSVDDILLSSVDIIIENSVYSSISRQSDLKFRNGFSLSEYEIKLACMKNLSIHYIPPATTTTVVAAVSSYFERIHEIKRKFNLMREGREEKYKGKDRTGQEYLTYLTNLAIKGFFHVSKIGYDKVMKKIYETELSNQLSALRQRLIREPMICLFYRGLKQWTKADFDGWIAAVGLRPIADPYEEIPLISLYEYPIQRFFGGNNDELKKIKNIELYDQIYMKCYVNDDRYNPNCRFDDYQLLRIVGEIEYGYSPSKHIISAQSNDHYIGRINRVIDIKQHTFSNRNRYLLVSLQKRIILYDMQMRQLLEVTKFNPEVSIRTFSEDDKLLCVQTNLTTAKLYRLGNGEPTLIKDIIIKGGDKAIGSIRLELSKLYVNDKLIEYEEHPMIQMMIESKLYDIFKNSKKKSIKKSKTEKERLDILCSRGRPSVKNYPYPILLYNDCSGHRLPIVGIGDEDKVMRPPINVIASNERREIESMNKIDRIKSLDYGGVINTGETSTLNITGKIIILSMDEISSKYTEQYRYTIDEDCFQETIRWFRNDRVYFCSKKSIYYLDFKDLSVVHKIRIHGDEKDEIIKGFTLFGACDIIVFVEEMVNSPRIIRLIYVKGTPVNGIAPRAQLISYGGLLLYGPADWVYPAIIERPTVFGLQDSSGRSLVDKITLIVPCVGKTSRKNFYRHSTVALDFNINKDTITYVNRNRFNELKNKLWTRILLKETDDYYCEVMKGMNSKKYSLVVFGNDQMVEIYMIEYRDPIQLTSIYEYRGQIKNFFWRWDPTSLIIVVGDKNENIIVQIKENCHPAW